MKRLLLLITPALLACSAPPADVPRPVPKATLEAKLATQGDRFASEHSIRDLAYCAETELVVGATFEGVKLWNRIGQDQGLLEESRRAETVALVGSRLYVARTFPPTVQLWDLPARKRLGEWSVGKQPKFFGFSSHGPPVPKVSMALAPSGDRLAVAFEDSVAVLSPTLVLERRIKRPTFQATSTLSASEGGVDVTDRFYRLQSVFWAADGRSVSAFVSSRMGAFGWRWDLNEAAPAPQPVAGGPGVAPGENKRTLVAAPAGQDGHPQWQGETWVDRESKGVVLRIIDDPELSWARELVRLRPDGTTQWRHVFRFPASAHDCFTVIDEVVLLGGGQRVEGGQLASRLFDLTTGREID